MPTVTGDASGDLRLFECPAAGGACLPVDVGLTGTGSLAATVPEPPPFAMLCLALALLGFCSQRASFAATRSLVRSG
jgi:hypothetical protein